MGLAVGGLGQRQRLAKHRLVLDVPQQAAARIRRRALVHQVHVRGVLRALLSHHDGLVLLTVELQQTVLVTKVLHLRSPHHRLGQVALNLAAVAPGRLSGAHTQSKESDFFFFFEKKQNCKSEIK